MTFTRRSVLAGTASWLLCPYARAFAADSAPRRRIAVVGGHPGDPEYGCGGTIARYAALGHEVTLLYLSRGEPFEPDRLGCTEPESHPGALLRVQEAVAACDILRSRPAFAGQCNGKSVVDPPHYDAFAAILRELDPDAIFTHWPVDNHADHRAAASLAYEAWLRMGRTPGLYYYEVSNGEDTQMFSPTDFVDITAFEPIKRLACYAHASQSPDRYYAMQLKVTHLRGLEAGVPQAEAFVRHVRSRPGWLP